VAGVVGIVAAMSCRGMRVTASVTSWVRAPCVGSLALRRGLGRDGVGARAQEGSGEAELAPEAKGVGRAGAHARALVIMDGLPCFFAIFIILIWVSLFMVPIVLFSVCAFHMRSLWNQSPLSYIAQSSKALLTALLTLF